jgi:hypothetical protein
MTNTSNPELMSDADFQAAVATPNRLGETSRMAAHRVLVTGEGVSDVARDMGVQRQLVSRAAQAVRGLHLARNAYPADWVQAVVVAPPGMLEKFKAAVERERKKAMKGI